MIELTIGFLITILSLLLGYNLGRHQQALTPDGKERLNRIFNRIAPKREGVGIITRPSAEDNFYRDHPQAKKEAEEMEKTFGALQEE